MVDLNAEVVVAPQAEALPVFGVPRPLSVELAICDSNVSVLTALIDRTASQARIVRDLRRQLTDFAVPYRGLDKRILEAIRMKVDENLTFDEASIRVFGTAEFARKLRYWRNRWEVR